VNPRHPIYIPSKGRAATQLTSRFLSAYGVPHFMVVERQQLAEYEAHRTPLCTLLVLDESYRDRHETLDDHGHTRSFGAGPARNFAWDHAVASGAEYHWDMDDNIRGFWRLNYNYKTPVTDGTVIRAMEAFVERYDNIALAGPQYYMFAPARAPLPPLVVNTRIYSCTLIRNDIPFRWRLRMNEDTDLSIRVLKAGWCTVQFNAFLQWKETTQKMPGGYTTEFYKDEGTMWKSQMLVDQHPDVARVTWRYGRWHHFVTYDEFMRRGRLRLRSGVEVPEGTDNFGMVLERQDHDDGSWHRVENPREGPRTTFTRRRTLDQLIEELSQQNGVTR